MIVMILCSLQSGSESDDRPKGRAFESRPIRDVPGAGFTKLTYC